MKNFSFCPPHLFILLYSVVFSLFFGSYAFSAEDTEAVVLPAYQSTEGDLQFVETSETEESLPVFGEALELPEEIQKALSFLPIVSPSYLRNFSTVTQNLHPGVEDETDIFYFVNSSHGQTAQQLKNYGFFIPSQHMVILRRLTRSIAVFSRGLDGQINGLNLSNVEVASLPIDRNGKIDYKQTPQFKSYPDSFRSSTPFIPVSTGILGDGGIKTFSGIFRLNERRSNERRMNVAQSAPMQYSIYINAEYNRGQESGVAAHGTPPQNWHLLGKSAASHGCIRLQSDFSRWNRQILFTQNRPGGSLIPRPELYGPVKLWNRREDRKSVV